MARGTKTTFLTLATICTAGCTSSDFVLQPQRQKIWQPVEEAKIHNAREEVPPKILPETYFAAGSLLEAQGLLGSAIEQYQKATAVNHEYVAAYHRLGLLFSAVGRHDEATKALRRAVVLLPDNAILRNNLGYSLMLQRSWADAEREFSRALELNPGFPRACINHGMALSRLGRFDAALASFEAVLPEADASYNLGLMYRGQHRFEKAVEIFRRVLSINPGFTAARTQLEQLAPHFPPAPPSEAVAGATEPVGPEGDTTLTPETAGDQETSSADSALVSRAEIDDTSGITDITDDKPGVEWDWLETMPEGIVAFGEFREYAATPEEIEARLQIVRNEIDCLEERETHGQDELTLDFTDLVCQPEPFVVSDATIASEADFVASAGEEDELFGPWLFAPGDSQLTLGQLLGILPPPMDTPKKTMGMSIVPPDRDTIDDCPADEPEIACHTFVEEKPDSCEEEEQAQDAAEEWNDVPEPASTEPADDRPTVGETGVAPHDINTDGDTDAVSKAEEVPGDTFYEEEEEEEIDPDDDADAVADAPDPNRNRKGAAPTHRVASTGPQPFAELTAVLSIVDNEIRCSDELEAQVAAAPHRDREGAAPDDTFAECFADEEETFSSPDVVNLDTDLLSTALITPLRPL